MATSTQYSPNVDLNKILLEAGASKTVYALVTPWTEAAKDRVFGNAGSAVRLSYLQQFREAWTGKQDSYHREFFETWLEWSKKAVELDADIWAFQYPTAGASEPLRHLIYDLAARTLGKARVHVFAGEYEGYKAMAEAAGLELVEHDRDIDAIPENIADLATQVYDDDLFFISQPSAIDGNVWEGFNGFLEAMPAQSVVADVTYVGSVPRAAIKERFNLNSPAIRNIVFSLSKPFGCYYDRIGGMLARKEDPGMFGNKWFKNLTSIALGTALMRNHSVFDIPERMRDLQEQAAKEVSRQLGANFVPSHVTLLATSKDRQTGPLAEYLERSGRSRVCLTPRLSELLAACNRRSKWSAEDGQ